MRDPLFADTLKTGELLKKPDRNLRLYDPPENGQDIYVRIIGTDCGRNCRIPVDVPYKTELDLAFLYYRELKDDRGSRIISCVRNNDLKELSLTLDELHFAAMENTVRDKKAFFVPLGDILNDECCDLSGPEIYVLSNEDMFLGASVMFYPGKLEEISKLISSDLIILPSSVHECLILPGISENDISKLAGIVKSVNDTVVSEKEILSYSVYYFSGKENKLKIY